MAVINAHICKDNLQLDTQMNSYVALYLEHSQGATALTRGMMFVPSRVVCIADIDAHFCWRGTGTCTCLSSVSHVSTPQL